MSNVTAKINAILAKAELEVLALLEENNIEHGHFETADGEVLSYTVEDEEYNVVISNELSDA